MSGCKPIVCGILVANFSCQCGADGMKPKIKLAEASLASGGGTLALYQHDGAFSMSINGQELMHSQACASERLMGTLGS